MDVVSLVATEVRGRCEEYKDRSEDHYDFWHEHIKYVYAQSGYLAERYGAETEIVLLGALLHDIALVCRVGERRDHHVQGRSLADDILGRYGYQGAKKDRVLSCVHNHRSPKNATSLEDLCVADADILAHFDNIPMLFSMAFSQRGAGLPELRDWMKASFEYDYRDLSDRTKALFADRYKDICRIVLGE
ncbi:MAG: HD domain-containing protein [Chloroflexi bacterium]|nr:HD domain-containing protein [Chloroflexota bacterium]